MKERVVRVRVPGCGRPEEVPGMSVRLRLETRLRRLPTANKRVPKACPEAAGGRRYVQALSPCGSHVRGTARRVWQLGGWAGPALVIWEGDELKWKVFSCIRK